MHVCMAALEPILTSIMINATTECTYVCCQRTAYRGNCNVNVPVPRALLRRKAATCVSSSIQGLTSKTAMGRTHNSLLYLEACAVWSRASFAPREKGCRGGRLPTATVVIQDVQQEMCHLTRVLCPCTGGCTCGAQLQGVFVDLANSLQTYHKRVRG